MIFVKLLLLTHFRLPLYSIDSCPRWHQRQDPSHQVHQGAGRVAFVAARLPQLVQARASDHQGRVELQTVGPEGRVLEELLRQTNTDGQDAGILSKKNLLAPKTLKSQGGRPG